MISEEKLVVFFQLQQVVLGIEDTSLLVQTLLPEVINRLASVNLNYEFLATVVTEKTKQSFLIERGSKTTIPAEGVINIEEVFNEDSEFNKMFLTNSPVLLDTVVKIINPIYKKIGFLESLIICPIIVANKVTGAFVIGVSRATVLITKDEIELLELIGNMLSSAYRLQDTQNSLTTITKEVYLMNAKLHQLDKLKDDFVSIASHELRTPMTAIRSYAWMALYRSDVPLTEKMQRYLSRTLISTERLINLVNDMLNVSRIESNSVTISPEPFNILKLVNDVLEEVASKAAEKGIHLTAHDGIKTPEVFADLDKVHQILLNLIGNALKFTPNQGTIEVGFKVVDGDIEVAIKDSGVGISKEDISKLFKKFERLDNSYVAAATTGGTGLGLYICRLLVDKMGGKIWASSEGLGHGTTFTFSLPIATADTLAHPERYKITPLGAEAKPLESIAL